MSNKKPIVIVIVIVSVVVLLSAILIYSNIVSQNTAANSSGNKVKPIDVDNIVENPEKYSGVINVEGKVKELSNKKNFFSLGCEDDEDADIPVLYKGELPKSESNIIVVGEIKKDADGKFFFDAREIKYK